MPKKKNTKLGTEAVLDSALFLAKRVGAKAILILAIGRINKEWMEKASKSIKLILIFHSKKLCQSYKRAGYEVVYSSPYRLARFSRIRHAIISALSKKMIKKNEKIVCLTGPVSRNVLDNIMVLKIGGPFTELTVPKGHKLEEDIELEVIKSVLDIATEIGTFGHGGRPVGTIFVIGDTANVLKLSRQITFNPFKGYEEKQKNIMDPEVQESIKEFAQIDGAFLIKSDGVVNTAGRLLLMPKEEVQILKGYGARHNAAAYITKKTKAIAVVVSETTGNVALFKNGKVLFTLEPIETYRHKVST